MAKAQTYQACCSQCYSWHKPHLSKKHAEVEAVSHMNVYGHQTFVLPEK